MGKVTGRSAKLRISSPVWQSYNGHPVREDLSDTSMPCCGVMWCHEVDPWRPNASLNEGTAISGFSTQMLSSSDCTFIAPCPYYRLPFQTRPVRPSSLSISSHNSLTLRACALSLARRRGTWDLADHVPCAATPGVETLESPSMFEPYRKASIWCCGRRNMTIGSLWPLPGATVDAAVKAGVTEGATLCAQPSLPCSCWGATSSLPTVQLRCARNNAFSARCSAVTGVLVVQGAICTVHENWYVPFLTFRPRRVPWREGSIVCFQDLMRWALRLLARPQEPL